MLLTVLSLILFVSAGFTQALSNSDFGYFNSRTTGLSKSSNSHGTNSSILTSTEFSPIYSTTESPSTSFSSRTSSTLSSLLRRPSGLGSKTSPSRSSSFFSSTTSSQRSSSRLGTRPSPHPIASSRATTSLSITKHSTSSSSSPTRSKLSKSTTTKSSSTQPSSSASTNTSTDLVAQASSIIFSHNYRSFCSAELGYSTYRSTKSVIHTVQSSTVVTRYPTEDTTTQYTEYTSLATSTVPATTEDISTTPHTTVYYTITQTTTTTVPSPSGSHQEKRNPPSRTSLSTPVPLQTYPPNILSSACSKNVAKPSSIADATTTLFSTKTHTYYDTEPSDAITSTIIHRTTRTITHGTRTSTSSFHTIEIDSFTFTTATATVTKSVTPFPLAPPSCLSPTALSCPIPLLGQVNNHSITYLAALDNTTTGTLLPNITSACGCAQACRNQTNCAGSYFKNGTCGYVGAERCGPGRVAAVYRGDEVGRGCEGWVIADGGCGVWGERGG